MHRLQKTAQQSLPFIPKWRTTAKRWIWSIKTDFFLRMSLIWKTWKSIHRQKRIQVALLSAVVFAQVVVMFSLARQGDMFVWTAEYWKWPQAGRENQKKMSRRSRRVCKCRRRRRKVWREHLHERKWGRKQNHTHRRDLCRNARVAKVGEEGEKRGKAERRKKSKNKQNHTEFKVWTNVRQRADFSCSPCVECASNDDGCAHSCNDPEKRRAQNFIQLARGRSAAEVDLLDSKDKKETNRLPMLNNVVTLGQLAWPYKVRCTLNSSVCVCVCLCACLLPALSVVCQSTTNENGQMTFVRKNCAHKTIQDLAFVRFAWLKNSEQHQEDTIKVAWHKWRRNGRTKSRSNCTRMGRKVNKHQLSIGNQWSNSCGVCGKHFVSNEFKIGRKVASQKNIGEIGTNQMPTIGPIVSQLNQSDTPPLLFCRSTRLIRFRRHSK